MVRQTQWEQAPDSDINTALLGRHIMRTFYISFSVSQGLVNPQINMLGLSASYYQAQYGRDATEEATASINDEFIENLKVPNTHKDIYLDGLQKIEFSDRWNDYKKQLNKRHGEYNPDSRSYQARLASMIGDIATRDLNYLAPNGEDADMSKPGRGRPNKKDPYKSFFREHALVASSSGDPNALDPIIADATNLLAPQHKLHMTTKLEIRKLQNNTLPRLAYSWENTHPNRQFDSSEDITNLTHLRIARNAKDLTETI